MVEQRVALILHPVRMRIIQVLGAGSGSRRLTAQQLAAIMPEVPRASLYRHLNRMTAGGVLRVVAERPARGQRERVYALADTELDAADLTGLSPAEHLQYFATFLGSLLGDFARYLEQAGDRIDYEADGVGYHEHVLYLTDREFTELIQRLNATLRAALGNGPAPGRRRRLLARICLPDAGDGDDEEVAP